MSREFVVGVMRVEGDRTRGCWLTGIALACPKGVMLDLLLLSRRLWMKKF